MQPVFQFLQEHLAFGLMILLIITIGIFILVPGFVYWSRLRELRAFSLFSISYTIVLLAFVLMELFTYLKISNQHFPETITILVVASACVMLTGLIWVFCCPDLIKKYSTVFDLLEKELEHHVRAEPHHRENQVLARLTRDTDRNAREMLESLKKSSIDTCEHTPCKPDCLYGKEIEKLHEGCVQRYLTDAWHQDDASKPYFRILAFLFYFFGLTLILFMLCYRLYLIYLFVRNQHVQ